jgi:hypothetical protein
MNPNLRTVAKRVAMITLVVTIAIVIDPSFERLFPIRNFLLTRAADAQVTYGGYSGSQPSGQIPGSMTAVLPSGTGIPTTGTGIPTSLDGTGTLSEADRTAISRVIAQYGSPAIDDSIKEYVVRAMAELDTQKVPGFKIDDKTAHRIEGPEIPITVVTPFLNLETPGLVATGALPKTWKTNQLRAWVVFRDADSSARSEATRGNGVLIDSETVLTARHVAQDVESNAKRISALTLGTKQGEFVTPLDIKGVIYLNQAVDPDLALIKIKPLADGASRWYPTLGKATPMSKTAIYSLGAMQIEELPKLTTGIITTSVKERIIHEGGTVPLTSFGTSLRSFPSISGSPIFEATSGALIGIVVAGVKEYAKTGEQLVKVDGGSATWERETRWTWAAPVPSFATSIRGAEKLRVTSVTP